MLDVLAAAGVGGFFGFAVFRLMEQTPPFAAWWSRQIRKKPKRQEPQLEHALKLLGHPFGLTVAAVQDLQTYLLYAGVGISLLLFAFTSLGASAFLPALLAFAAGWGGQKWIIRQAKKREHRIKREMAIFLDAFHALYRSQVSLEESIRSALDVTRDMKRIILPMMSMWHSRKGPEAVIESISQFGVNDLRNMALFLRQVLYGTKTSETALQSYLEQIKQVLKYEGEEESAKRPVFYTILLGIPFAAAVVVWFLPFILQAVEAISEVTGLGAELGGGL